MKTITTFDGKIVCNVASWPPKQNIAGCWELTVYGESFVFELLSDHYYGCDFRVDEFILCNLQFVRGEVFPSEDEVEIFIMGFAKIVHSETGRDMSAFLESMCVIPAGL